MPALEEAEALQMEMRSSCVLTFRKPARALLLCVRPLLSSGLDCIVKTEDEVIAENCPKPAALLGHSVLALKGMMFSPLSATSTRRPINEMGDLACCQSLE